jgi:ribosomal protein S1
MLVNYCVASHDMLLCTHVSQVGSKVTCRVLLADAKDRKLLVTLKKSMVKDTATSPVTTYEQATRGTTATGFVTKVSRMLYMFQQCLSCQHAKFTE